MIVISDGDIIKNEVAPDGNPYPVGFDKFSRKNYAGNQELILNSVNYLCDDGGLMTIRSRELKLRLIDDEKIKNKKTVIQLVNVILPLVFIILFGFVVIFIRKRKYTR